MHNKRFPPDGWDPLKDWTDWDITTSPDWWRQLGFADLPTVVSGYTADRDVFHVSSSTELAPVPGKGRWFTTVEPTSVLDAERRLNVALFGNTMRFVTKFRIKGGVPYLLGRAYNGADDLSLPAHQIYVHAAFVANVIRIDGPRVLRQDATMVHRIGSA
jgi:hypothetical protein